MKAYRLILTLAAVLAAGMACAQGRFEVFPSKSPVEVHYRIPAIAALSDGTVVCVADYRHSREDIGIVKDGRIDLRVRISRDNGKTWGEIFPMIEGKGKESPDFMNVGFGDPCIVADRKSGRLMVISCAGNVSFIKGTPEEHLCITRFYSQDGGLTWTAPEDIAPQLYSLFENAASGPAESMFITSGRIVQSRYVKVKKYYRLYCAALQAAGDGRWLNYVLYSDDFGNSWNVLGGVDKAPIVKEANEAKVEELPGGDLLITSRTDLEGRMLNVFTFDNLKKATGSWGTMTHSGAHNNGIVTEKNSCNGELMVVPVIRKSDGRKMDLLLQSVPVGPKRANVGIFYKALELDGSGNSSESVAKDWEGRYICTNIGSAYSVMAWQADGRLGFAFEEKTYYPNSGCGYTIVYDNYDIEQITSGAYAYNPKGW